jgi:hypothetical protein
MRVRPGADACTRAIRDLVGEGGLSDLASTENRNYSIRPQSASNVCDMTVTGISV